MLTPAASVPLKNILSDALRYWEWRRIPYNLVLGLVVVGSISLTWPRSTPVVSVPGLLFLFVLAVIANVCYTTAYVVDVPLQLSEFRAGWRRWRWALWALGTFFAALLAFYWMGDEVIGL